MLGPVQALLFEVLHRYFLSGVPHCGSDSFNSPVELFGNAAAVRDVCVDGVASLEGGSVLRDLLAFLADVEGESRHDLRVARYLD